MSGENARPWWHGPAYGIGVAGGIVLLLTPRLRLFGVAALLSTVGAMLGPSKSDLMRGRDKPAVPRVDVMTTGLGSVPAFVFGVPKRAQRIQALLAVMMALVPVLYAWPMLTGGVRGPGFTVLRFLMAWVVARRARFVARNLSGLHLEWVIAFTPVALVATAEGRTSVMWDDVTGATIPSSRSNFAFVHVVAQRDRVRRDTRFPQLRQLRRRRASEIWFPGHSLEGAPEFVRWAIEHYARDPEHRAEIGTEWERARLLAAYSRVATGR